MVVSGSTPSAREALLRALRERATKLRWISLELRADPLERRAPYGVVQGLVELLRPHLAREEGWASPLAGLVAMASPTEGGRQGAAPEGVLAGAFLGGSSSSVLNSRSDLLPRAEEVRAELSDIVRSQAKRTPLLATVHPAELVDAPSAAFFSEIARELPGVPLVIVLSLDERAKDARATWRKALPPSASCRWESVASLQPGSSVPPEEIVQQEVARLPAVTRRLLGAVVAAGPDASVDLLGHALNLPAPKVLEGAAPAEARGLLEVSGRHLRAREPALRSALLDLMSLSDRQALHGALYRALRAKHPASTAAGKLVFRLAEHAEASGVPEEAASALLSAGWEASVRGAHEEAESLLRAALGHAQGVPTAEGRELEERVQAALGVVLEMKGDVKAAVAALERATAISQARKASVERWGPYLARESRLLTSLGIATSGVDEKMLQAIPMAQRLKLPSTEAELRASVAHRYLVRGLWEEGKHQSLLSVELAEAGGEPAVLARALRMAALALSMGPSKEERDARALLEKLTSTMSVDRAGGEYSFALDDLATLACSEHREEEALRLGRRSVEHARRHCSRGDLLLMLGNYGEHQLHAQDLAGATQTLQEVRELADRYQLPPEHSVRQQYMLAESLRLRLAGDLPSSFRMLEETAALGERLGARDIMGQALAYLVVLSVEKGDFDAARAHLRRLEREGLRRVLFTTYREMLERAIAKIPPKGR